VRLALDALALLLLVLQLWIPVFWLLIHPGIRFWRRLGRAWYTGAAVTVWLGVAATLLLPYQWWLAARFTSHPLAGAAGAALVAVDFWLLGQVKQQLSLRVLVGLAELERSPVVPAAAGIYSRVRHPRYLGMMLSWLGAVLLTGATRLLVLVFIFIGLAYAATELEERELVARFGDAYADYRRRVPRLIPRWR
jgi:protein-S-isoprenylcysteine O-methyltransferase Ste14